VSCEGHAAAGNPYFSNVKFNAAKGDILTIRFREPIDPPRLHRGIWLAKANRAGTYWLGSTYERERLDEEPGAAARAEIEDRFRAFFRTPYDVTSHRAAVRPAIAESRAVIGLHPEHPRLGYFNGLGSKGALHAPWYAAALTGALVRRAPLPHFADVRRHF